MSRLLRITVRLIGAICVVIALAHIAVGPLAIPGGVFVNTTMDSEDRFYATLFLGWGAALIHCAGDLQGREPLFKWLLFIFFLGGIARIISALAVGLPNVLFVFLGSLELVVPPLLWWWHRALKAAHSTEPAS